MRKAIYAGSFDPPTLGHLWMIQEAAKMFDEVVVSVGVNPDKKSMFGIEERIDMLREMIVPLTNVSVSSYCNQYLVSHASELGVNFIVRGIRNGNDYEYERAMRNINADLNADISTVFLMPPKNLSEISSSIIKGLIGPHGWEKVLPLYVPESVFFSIVTKTFTLFDNLLSVGVTGEGKDFWKRLIIPYLDNSRHYHDLNHIRSMLEEFGQIKHLLNDPLAVEMAIWFHDFIYDTSPPDVCVASNEDRSAYHAERVIRDLGLSDSFADKVKDLILATKHNFIPLDNDAQYLVDLDLLVLGKSESEFDLYENGIRKEYSFIADDVFAKKRAEILRGFLGRDFIFLTEYFREKYEAPARKNLKRSISRLEGL